MMELNKRGKTEYLVTIYKDLQEAYSKLNHWVREEEFKRNNKGEAR